MYLYYTDYKMIMSVCRYPDQLSKNDLCRIINLTALPITFKKIVKQKCNLPQSENEYDKCHPTEYNQRSRYSIQQEMCNKLIPRRGFATTIRIPYTFPRKKPMEDRVLVME
jgi:hypothetical protein